MCCFDFWNYFKYINDTWKFDDTVSHRLSFNQFSKLCRMSHFSYFKISKILFKILKSGFKYFYLIFKLRRYWFIAKPSKTCYVDPFPSTFHVFEVAGANWHTFYEWVTFTLQWASLISFWSPQNLSCLCESGRIVSFLRPCHVFRFHHWKCHSFHYQQTASS